MNKLFSLTSLLLLSCYLSVAYAEIYKQVDADGRVTYSNVKIKGAKKLDLEPADSNFGTTKKSESKSSSEAKTATPNSFPKVDKNTQTERDVKRKEILKAELDQEKQALEKAKQAYAEGASNPEVYKTKDGKTLRNVAKFDEKMKALQAEVDAHQRNVDLLTNEIGD
ncbi:MAG TPA: DUF4124 domain-containing protein [Methylophilaceae bacterium]|nr:DUF4124 domain-containing protein [Methylophilaceae bacterium]HAJ72355.1 DUF4124 domain-containing protein [Methylophilaceae bacterium]